MQDHDGAGPSRQHQSTLGGRPHVCGSRFGYQNRKVHFHPVDYIDSQVRKRTADGHVRLENPRHGAGKGDAHVVRIFSRRKACAAIAVHGRVLAWGRAGSGGAIESGARRESSVRAAPKVGQQIDGARQARSVGRALSGLPVEPQIGHIRAEARKGRQKDRKYDCYEYGDLAGIRPGPRPRPARSLLLPNFSTVNHVRHRVP